MSVYKPLTNDDVATNVAKVTSGVFQDGASSIATFFTSSTQYTNTGVWTIQSSNKPTTNR